MGASAKSERTMIDHLGNAVPSRYVSKIDKERDRTVRLLFRKAEHINAQLAAFRGECLEVIEAFLDWEACQSEGPRRGPKGNVSLPSFDGTMRVTRARQASIEFDERMQTARGLILEHISDKAKGIDRDLIVIIDDAFKGAEGRLSTGRVLGLLKLNIEGEKWRAAMDLIRQSIRVTATREYARFYRRPGGAQDEYKQVPLDIASA